jgi:hypothetical protein
MKKTIISIIMLLLPAAIFAQAKYEGLKIEKLPNSYIVEFTLPKITYSEITAMPANQKFTHLSINDEYGIIGETGKPELPQLTFDFEIAFDENMPEVKIIKNNKTTKKLTSPVYPFQEPISTELQNKQKKFDYNSNYYQTNGIQYDIISVSEPYIIAGKKGVKITIAPINYNPKSEELTITDFLVFEIKSSTTQKTEKSFSQANTSFFSSHFVNFKPKESKSIEYGNYLIITAPQYEQTINYFAVYKENLGYNVTVVNTGTTGTSTDNIKNFIQTQYDNASTRPTFVLLVGDTDEIPSWTGEAQDNPATDLYYSTLEGDDMFPDVFLGRFSVRTMNPINTDIFQLQNIINKTIFTETNVQSTDKKAVFPADDDFFGYFTAAHDWAIKNTFEPDGYQCLKLYDGDGATSQDLIDALNDNYRFCIYSGHGSTDGFSAPSLSILDLNGLTNTIFPFGYGFACRTNNYSITETFGEAWIRVERGGVSYIGSSHTTWYRDDKVLEKKVFGDAFLDEPQLSPMFNVAMQRYWNWAFGSRREKYIEQYNLMGDPSLITTGIANSCFASYIFDRDVVFHSGANITIQADQTIVAGENNSSFAAENGTNITFAAGEIIVLKPGFHANAGSNFHANITPCSGKTLAKVKSNTSDARNAKPDSLPNNTTKCMNFAKAYPNPFKNQFTIEYTLDSPSHILIEVFNIHGSKVYSFSENCQNTGVFTHCCNLPNNTSGLYIIKIQSENYIQSIVTLKIQ